MDDALGIGLAATQLGVMHRVLVYRVEPDSAARRARQPGARVVEPRQETMEEGCLSLPGVNVDVERPVHVRVRAQDESGEALVIEASGLEARVIQHEMDHLDGVLILDRTSRDQRKRRHADPARAGRASRPPSRAERRTARRAHRLPRHLRVRRRRPRAARGRARTGRRSSSRAPDRPRGRGAGCSRRRSPSARASSASTLAQPEDLHAPEASQRHRRGRSRRRSWSAPTARSCASRCCPRYECSTCTRRCCRAGAAPRRSSGRSWRATPRPA